MKKFILSVILISSILSTAESAHAQAIYRSVVGIIGGGSHLAISGTRAALSGSFLYYTGPDVSVEITSAVLLIDLSIPSQPMPLKIITSSDFGVQDSLARVLIVGDYLYILPLIGNNLYTVNIADAAHPVFGTTLNLTAHGANFAQQGQYLYVGCQSAGLAIVDIATPNAPKLVRIVDTPGNANGVRVSGDYAYVADTSALKVFNIHNPNQANIVGTLALSNATSLELSAGRVYIKSDPSMRIVDVSTPEQPVLMGAIPKIASLGGQSGSPNNSSISGQRLYIAHGLGGLEIVDVSNATAPRMVDSVHLPGLSVTAIAQGKWIYVTTGQSSNPDNAGPVLSVVYDPNGYDPAAVPGAPANLRNTLP